MKIDQLKQDRKNLIEGVQYLRANDELKMREEIHAQIEQATYHAVSSATEVTASILNRITATRIPFVDHTALDPYGEPYLGVYKDDLVVVAGGTGKGKSTIAANLALSYTSQPLKVLYIANEESELAVWQRLACLRLGIGVNSLNKRTLTPELASRLETAIADLATKIDIKSTTNIGSGSLALADVYEPILAAAKGKYSAIIIDYYQSIKRCNGKNADDANTSQDRFADTCNKHKDLVGCPIFVMAQSHNLNANSIRSDFLEVRAKGRKTLYERATLLVELQRVPSNTGAVEATVELAGLAQLKDIVVIFLHKSRYDGLQGQAFCYRWERGFYKFIKVLDQATVEQFDEKTLKRKGG